MREETEKAVEARMRGNNFNSSTILLLQDSCYPRVNHTFFVIQFYMHFYTFISVLFVKWCVGGFGKFIYNVTLLQGWFWRRLINNKNILVHWNVLWILRDNPWDSSYDIFTRCDLTFVQRQVHQKTTLG